MKLKCIAATFLLCLFISCNENIETKKVEGKYTIDLPSYLDETKDLNKAASLQYKNDFKEFYVLVFDESTQDFHKALSDGGLDYEPNLNGYSEILATDIAKSSGLSVAPKMQNRTINNLDARILQFDGRVNDVDVFWKIAYLKGKNRYYQILTWTLSTKKTDNEAAMDAILNSFKETDKSKSR